MANSIDNKEFRMIEGIRNVKIAQFHPNTGTYDPFIPVIGLQEFSATSTYKEGSANGDMKVLLTKKKIKQKDITMTLAEYPAELEAIVEGKEYVNGELITSDNDNQNSVAIAFEEVWSDGSYTDIVYYDVKLARDNREGKGNSDNIDFQSISLTGTALYSDVAKSFDMVIDSRADDVDKDKLKYFFDVVQFPKVGAIIPTEDVEYTGYATGEVTDISLEGVTFDTISKKFSKVPVNVTSFTFKLDGTDVTATKGTDGNYTFA